MTLVSGRSSHHTKLKHMIEGMELLNSIINPGSSLFPLWETAVLIQILI